MSLRVPLQRIVVLGSALGLGLSLSSALTGCAGDKKPDTKAVAGPPAAARLDLPAVAVATVPHESLDGAALTRALADAVAHTAGVDAIDQLAMEASVMGCPEPPCRTPEQEGFESASVVITATVARTGESWIASGTARERISVIARAVAQAKDPVAAIEDLGFQLGASLHEVLKARAPAAAEGADPAEAP
jgi:hypothetical protein